MHSKSKALRVLKSLNRLTINKGRPPTIRELQQNLSYGSTNSVWYWLNVLESDGYITRLADARNTLMTEEGIRYVKENTRIREKTK